MTTTGDPTVIAAGVEPAAYHQNRWRAVSSSTLRQMLKAPAIARHEHDNPTPPTAAMDFGTVVHTLVLGRGERIVEVVADDWRTSAAKAAKAAAHAAGKAPILSKDLDRARAAAAAVHEHPIAGGLLAPGTGTAEAVVLWTDERTGVPCRAMVDWWPIDGPGRPMLVDVKTSDDSDPRAFSRTAERFGYHIQDRHYAAGARAVGLDDPAFLFVVVRKEPPHLVSVVQLDAAAQDVGDRLRDAALDRWVRCTETGVWPGYPGRVHLVGLPRFARDVDDLDLDDDEGDGW